MSSGKNPWFDRMPPEEFRGYYERKMDLIDSLTGECKRDGCDEQAMGISFDYCSSKCRSAGLQQAARRVADRLEEASDGDS